MARGYRLPMLIIGIALVASCGASRHVPVIQRDSTVVRIKDSLILRDSIVFVEVPQESDKAVVPFEDSSHLETSVSVSDAWVKEGRLHHELRNKNVQIPAPVVIKEKLITENKEHMRVLWKEKIVEKDLSDWQVLQIILGRISLIIIVVLLIRVVLKFCK